MKKETLFFLMICITTNLHSQVFKLDMKDYDKRPKPINEVINQLGADSIVFYYNDRYQMVKPNCSTLFRVVKVDSILSFFSGRFTDYYPDSLAALIGNYTNGKKEEFFEFYYPNGQLEKSGTYTNDNKTGVWNYYYEDGSKHQVLEFKQKNILVLEFWDEKSKHLVDSGNGDWFGYETNEHFMKVSGKILNGKRIGVWKKDIPSNDFIMNLENFSNGQFSNGNINSIVNGTKPYNDTSYCIIEQPEIFLTAKIFEMNQCFPKLDNRWVFAKYQGGNDKFNRELKKKLILNNSQNIIGKLRVQTTIDSEGKMTN